MNNKKTAMVIVIALLAVGVCMSTVYADTAQAPVTLTMEASVEATEADIYTGDKTPIKTAIYLIIATGIISGVVVYTATRKRKDSVSLEVKNKDGKIKEIK